MKEWGVLFVRVAGMVDALALYTQGCQAEKDKGLHREIGRLMRCAGITHTRTPSHARCAERTNKRAALMQGPAKRPR